MKLDHMTLKENTMTAGLRILRPNGNEIKGG
jgi:hypothetical protein